MANTDQAPDKLVYHTVQFASHNPRFTVTYHKQSTIAYCRGLQLHTVQFTAISYSVGHTTHYIDMSIQWRDGSSRNSPTLLTWSDSRIPEPSNRSSHRTTLVCGRRESLSSLHWVWVCSEPSIDQCPGREPPVAGWMTQYLWVGKWHTVGCRQRTHGIPSRVSWWCHSAQLCRLQHEKPWPKNGPLRHTTL